MEKVKVLEYTGEILEGSSGLYVNFSGCSSVEDHWTITGKIAKSLNILKDSGNLDSDIDWGQYIDWGQLINKIRNQFQHCVYLTGKIFPEFSSKSDLLTFIHFLNVGANKTIINLKYLV